MCIHRQDLDHLEYVEFHRDMYVLTDVAVMHTLRKYPSVSHVVVTNGDNVYAGNFFAKTCHVQAVSACAGWRGQALGGCVGGDAPQRSVGRGMGVPAP